mmetsp:Transcript_17442/g.50824  ORF Transcript_17442/g.50824 Transcript_17442/m.50824 type:complete len:423 (-) Transcript_17442:1592-2860(-)
MLPWQVAPKPPVPLDAHTPRLTPADGRLRRARAPTSPTFPNPERSPRRTDDRPPVRSSDICPGPCRTTLGPIRPPPVSRTGTPYSATSGRCRSCPFCPPPLPRRRRRRNENASYRRPRLLGGGRSPPSPSVSGGRACTPRRPRRICRPGGGIRPPDRGRTLRRGIVVFGLLRGRGRDGGDDRDHGGGDDGGRDGRRRGAEGAMRCCVVFPPLRGDVRRHGVGAMRCCVVFPPRRGDCGGGSSCLRRRRDARQGPPPNGRGAHGSSLAWRRRHLLLLDRRRWFLLSPHLSSTNDATASTGGGGPSPPSEPRGARRVCREGSGLPPSCRSFCTASPTPSTTVSRHSISSFPSEPIPTCATVSPRRPSRPFWSPIDDAPDRGRPRNGRTPTSNPDSCRPDRPSPPIPPPLLLSPPPRCWTMPPLH